MANNHLKVFGMIPGVAVIGGFIVTTLLSVFTADFKDATLTTIDGLRVDFADGWGLVRASNTEPALTLRFEADSDESLENIKSAFRELLQKVKSDLNFE